MKAVSLLNKQENFSPNLDINEQTSQELIFIINEIPYTFITTQMKIIRYFLFYIEIL